MREAIHVLREVTDPLRPSPGRLRQATGAERDLLIGWEQAFAIEAGVAVRSEAERIVSRRLAQGAQFVWDDEGPVATLVISPAIAGTVRIGPVYTPPERRRRGYASSAVAAASRRVLAGGARQCTLFTDLANPTSNQIYAAVGYRRCGEWEEYAFSAP
jgi:predicted GNAT family acetyltransferase